MSTDGNVEDYLYNRGSERDLDFKYAAVSAPMSMWPILI